MEHWNISNVPHTVQGCDMKKTPSCVFFTNLVLFFSAKLQLMRFFFFKPSANSSSVQLFLRKGCSERLTICGLDVLFLSPTSSYFSDSYSLAAPVNVFTLKWFEWFCLFWKSLFLLSVFCKSTCRPQRVAVFFFSPTVCLAVIQSDTNKMWSEQPVTWETSPVHWSKLWRLCSGRYHSIATLILVV